MKDNNDLESSDRHIQINNTDGRSVQIQSSDMNKNKNNNSGNDFIENQKHAYASKLVQSATETVTRSWYEKCICGLTYLKKYFNVTTVDVRSRLLYSLIPFNPKFYDISENSPDLYGPFWIYTTLIFIIAAAGSLAKYIIGDSSQNFFQNFIPVAAGIIYGIGFVLPIVLGIFMKCFGSATTFASVICIYGYSLTIFVPVVVACSVPVDLMQWLLIAYAVFHSTSLILVNYWKELSKYMERKRYFLMAIIIICQAGLFLVLKLYFFEELNKQQEDLKNIITNGTNSTISNSTKNSTLLF